MTSKIIYYQDVFLLHFAISDYLEKNFDCKQFALIDTTDKVRTFFEKQSIVKFEKEWYLHDHITINPNKIDMNFLKEFEEKYSLDLWKLSLNERHFYRFNKFYKFNDKEILSIIEQESKLFESILDEVKPDFFIMFQPSLRPEFLFYELCVKKNITPLIINPSLLGYRTYISKDIGNLEHSEKMKNIISKNRSFNELRKYREQFNLNRQINEYVEDFGDDENSTINAGFEFLFKSNNSNINSHYTYFGRTKNKVLLDAVKSRILKRKIRKSFIDNNLTKKIDGEKFVYFPLQVDPDRNLLLGTPLFTNQIETIRQIVKSLPIDYTLYVKEHPGQRREWREIEYYKEILDIPNVQFLHPSVPSEEIYKKCDLIITTGSSSGFEALFFEKPSIVFGDVIYNKLPCVTKINDYSSLRSEIKKSIKTKVNSDDLDKFVTFLEETSFNFDLFGYFFIEAKEFFHDAVLKDVLITEEQMKKFLEKNSDMFKIIGTELVKNMTNKT
tara:strand:+ start:5273 stop:6769 length:1497 start_codon:yes stop_codon:yes gene_type:complete